MRTLAALRRALFGLGLVLCVACPPDRVQPSAELLNHRNAKLVATLRELRVERYDCAPYSVSEAQKLTRADFGAPQTLDLEAEGSASLGSWRECGAVWLTIGHDFDHVVTWQHLTGWMRTRDEQLQRSWFRHQVVVEGTRQKLVITVGSELTALPAPGDGPAYLHALEDAGVDAGANDALAHAIADDAGP